MSERPAFERDTTHRLAVEVARHSIISRHLAGFQIDMPHTMFVYQSGPFGMNWGQDLLKGKRVRVTIEVEDYE